LEKWAGFLGELIKRDGDQCREAAKVASTK
jgi:hypothetical protein